MLYVVDRYPSYSETFIAHEIEGLSRRGLDVRVLSLHRPPAELPPAASYLISPAGTFRALARPYVPWRSTLALLKGSVRPGEWARLCYAELHAARAFRPARRAAVVHVHAHFLVRPADVARVLAERLGVPWTATGHAGDVYDSSHEPHLQDLRLASVDEVACISRDIQRRLARDAPDVATRVIHCGVEVGPLIARGDPRAVGEPKPRFVTVGRLQVTKGYRTVLEAARELRNREVQFRWDVVGEGPLRGQIAAFLDREGLSGHVVVRGALAHEGALELMAGATALVLPCQHTPARLGDGIPVVLMEAMAMGTVVVTCPVGGIPELVVDGESGFLVPPEEPEALARLLEELAGREDSSLEVLRGRARRTVADRFDVEQQVERMAEFLFGKSRPTRQSS